MAGNRYASVAFLKLRVFPSWCKMSSNFATEITIYVKYSYVTTKRMDKRKSWWNTILNLLDRPRSSAVAAFRFSRNHDFLYAYFFRLRLMNSPAFPLCRSGWHGDDFWPYEEQYLLTLLEGQRFFHALTSWLYVFLLLIFFSLFPCLMLSSIFLCVFEIFLT